MTMGASNHPALRFPKGQARAVDAETEARDAKAHERKVYARVDVRDKKRCCCCRRHGDPGATTSRGLIHHDHLVARSLGGATSTPNIASLCAVCHAFKTAHQIEPAGNPDAGTLTFTITAKAAAVVFKNRARPKHVRIVG